MWSIYVCTSRLMRTHIYTCHIYSSIHILPHNYLSVNYTQCSQILERRIPWERRDLNRDEGQEVRRKTKVNMSARAGLGRTVPTDCKGWVEGLFPRAPSYLADTGQVHFLLGTERFLRTAEIPPQTHTFGPRAHTLPNMCATLVTSGPSTILPTVGVHTNISAFLQRYFFQSNARKCIKAKGIYSVAPK